MLSASHVGGLLLPLLHASQSRELEERRSVDLLAIQQRPPRKQLHGGPERIDLVLRLSHDEIRCDSKQATARMRRRSLALSTARLHPAVPATCLKIQKSGPFLEVFRSPEAIPFGGILS